MRGGQGQVLKSPGFHIEDRLWNTPVWADSFSNFSNGPGSHWSIL